MKRALLNCSQNILGNPFNVAFLEGTQAILIYELIDKLRPRWRPDDLIRVGGQCDGGYLVPPDVDSYDLLISPGVGQSYDFDRYFIDRKVDSVLIDPGVSLPVIPHLFHIKKFLVPNSSETDGLISLPAILQSFGKEKQKILLQMDIEGAEYAILASLDDVLISRFSMIVIEFHYLAGLCYRGMFPLIDTAFRKIIKSHFVAHMHVNNSGRVVPYKGIKIPDTLEITFLNKDIYPQERHPNFKSPHRLDVSCLDNVPDVPVPKSWW